MIHQNEQLDALRMRLHRHYVGLYSLLRMALTKNILILSGKNYFSYEISTAIEPFVYV